MDKTDKLEKKLDKITLLLEKIDLSLQYQSRTGNTSKDVVSKKIKELEEKYAKHK